jgi:hypothetical protein
MAGPSASVLLREQLTYSQEVGLREYINAVSEHDLDKSPSLDDFSVGDTRSVGGGYSGGGRPFSLSTGLQPDWELEQLLQVHAEFGFLPVDELLVIAFCNGDQDHRILGELCVWLVERMGGIINFGGALWPPVPASAGIDFLHADWRQVEPYFQEMVMGMPGRVSGLGYETQSGRQWVIHVADAVFARAWLDHPRFRMVK